VGVNEHPCVPGYVMLSISKSCRSRSCNSSISEVVVVGVVIAALVKVVVVGVVITAVVKVVVVGVVKAAVVPGNQCKVLPSAGRHLPAQCSFFRSIPAKFPCFT
jgi:hypothetical protein